MMNKRIFTGTIDELKENLKVLHDLGEWEHLNENQYQYKYKFGGVINWYPSTGRLLIQGKKSQTDALDEILETILDNKKGDIAQQIKKSEAINAEENTTVNKEAVSSYKEEDFLGNSYTSSELIIGLVGAVGVNHDQVVHQIEERLKSYNYTCEVIQISKDIIQNILSKSKTSNDEYERTIELIELGNKTRAEANDNSVLALYTASLIHEKREKIQDVNQPFKRKAFIIKSLKHPEEVNRLREIYSSGFYLIGVHSDESRRYEYLTQNKRMDSNKASALMERDANEIEDHGQHTADTFHMSDFFIRLDGDSDKSTYDVWRMLDLIFARPNLTPTFDEYAMFMAFTSSLRSGDLSRQVGAVVARDNEIIAMGANDCPKFGGGLYWPKYDEQTKKVIDEKDGRDYERGYDSNSQEIRKIIDSIIEKLPESVDKTEVEKALKESRIKDITEYGRVVHAEMEALMMCARNNITTKKATIYCTTFPCHNCAKHIIASGVERVVYIEPYPKSKTAEFHSDSVTLGFSNQEAKTVRFEPFVGIGPRKFFDLFSMKLGSGSPTKRKDKEGNALDWKPENAKLKIQLLPYHYIQREELAIKKLNSLTSR